MKTAAFVLTLLLAGTQSFIASDCCCAIVCKHHSEVCSKCAHEGAANAGADADAKECCARHGESAPAPEKRCAHLEPSSEVAVLAADAVTAPPTLVLDAPLASETPTILVPVAVLELGLVARGSPPLHLLNSVFLI